MTKHQPPSAQHTFKTLKRTLYHWWNTQFLLRWVLANMLGWILGLSLLSLMLWLLGWLGAIFVGAGIGAGIGVPQAWILFTSDEMALRRKWILYSAIGGFFAVFPVVGLAIIGLFNLWIAAFLIGLAFGGIFGLLQSFVFVPDLGDDAYWWIVVSIVAAVIASLSMVFTFYLPLPIIASPATILYAFITGWQLNQWTEVGE